MKSSRSHSVVRHAWRTIGLPCAIFIAGVGPCLGAPPPNASANPGISAWFNSLQQPTTSLSCCERADCRRVEYRVSADGQYEVYLEGLWRKVPESIIIRGKTNPTGSAVACYLSTTGSVSLPDEDEKDPAEHLDLMCFVPPAPAS